MLYRVQIEVSTSNANLRGIAQSGSAPALGAGCREFDKIAGSDFERTKCGPKGGGQGARSNLSTPANVKHWLVSGWKEIDGYRLGLYSVYVKNPGYSAVW